MNNRLISLLALVRSPMGPRTLKPTSRLEREDGFALPSVILALIVVSSLLVASFATTRMEVANVASTVNTATGFYSAEAGLNIRGEMVRQEFQGYNRPGGESPDPADACESGNLGSEDFACFDFEFNNRDVSTYVVEDPRNNDEDDSERMITIPAGERFAGLNAIQYRYSVISEAATIRDPRPESILEMVFRARLVPLFQFAAFYDKDLEILPGPDMTLAGPIHVNGDLYVNANSTLSIGGAITVSQQIDGVGGTFWRGRKDRNECTGTVRVNDADVSTNPEPSIGCPRRLVPQTELNDWNGRIDTGLQTVTVPPPEEFAPGGLYWQDADLVVALDLRDGLDDAEVIVPNRAFSGNIGSISVNNSLTNILWNDSDCRGNAPRSYEVNNDNSFLEDLDNLPSASNRRAVEWSNSFRDRRENWGNSNARNSHRVMLEVDVEALLDCMHEENDLFDDGPSAQDDLDDTSSGGLVWYFTVLGDESDDASSGYGVRLRNGARLASTIGGAPEILGLTVVSDQAVFIEGNYNLDDGNWRPASVMSDALNILSRRFADRWSQHISSKQNAWSTEVNAAFMSGTHTTGGVNGTGGQGGDYNGGLENYPIFHENWGGQTLTYLGSFVSLEEPNHSSGPWTAGSQQYYNAPGRDWGFDTRFNDATNLPPLSPRFVYLIQERFVRDFTQQ